MSANTTVTVRRDSWEAGLAAAAAIGVPHARQNLARAGFDSPHASQRTSVVTARSCTGAGAGSSGAGHTAAAAAGALGLGPAPCPARRAPAVRHARPGAPP